MRTHLIRHPKYLIATSIALLVTIAALLGTTGVLAGATGLPFGATSACGCVAAAEFSIAANPMNITGKGVIKFTITNVSGHTATIPNLGIKFTINHKEFFENKTQVSLCEKSYAPAATCPFEVEYEGKTAESLGTDVEGTNNVKSGVTVNGSP